MRQIAHHHAVLKGLAMAAAVMAGAPSQAALTNLTLDSGLPVSQDAATGLLWRSFDDATAGAQAGFRQATVADFETLLRNNGYTATGSVPYGLTHPALISPEVTKTVTIEQFYMARGGAVPKAFLDEQAVIRAEYEAALISDATDYTPEEIKDSYYTAPMRLLKSQYSVRSRDVLQTVVTPAVYETLPSLTAGGVSASSYSSTADSYMGMAVAGAHSYDNNVSFGEAHFFIMGLVQSDVGYWVGATVYDFVARQCGPGDPGFYGYETVTRYCGGTSSTYGYLGPSASTEFQANRFNHVDNISVNNKPVGYLMVQSVPEPSTYALMGLGLVGMAWVRSRRSRRCS